MTSDATYYVLTVFMALAVIITCGLGITWIYFSSARWSERKGTVPDIREHHATSPFADRPTDDDQQKLAA